MVWSLGSRVIRSQSLPHCLRPCDHRVIYEPNLIATIKLLLRRTLVRSLVQLGICESGASYIDSDSEKKSLTNIVP